MNRYTSIVPQALIVAIGSAAAWQTSVAQECPEAEPCLAQRVDPPADGLVGLFGSSIARDNDRAIIGRPFDDELGTKAGAAFVYYADPELGWVLEQKLTADDGEADDLLGLAYHQDQPAADAVAICGDVAMVGAPGDDDRGSSAGAVYVFQRQEAGWVQVQKLLAPEGLPEDRLSTVALAGDVAVVGAPNSRGYALVFHFDGATWTYQQELDFESVFEFDAFGWSIDISDGIIAVGALGYDGFNGAVFIYQYDDKAERWEFQQRLDAPDPLGNPQYGSSLDIGGSPARLIVGAFGVRPGPRGAAYIYEHDGSEWVLEQRLLATDCEPEVGPCLFGWGVGIVSEPVWRAVVTTLRFAGYEFRFDGTEWCETRQWQPPLEEANNHFVVALQGESALLGTPYGGPDGDQGRFYEWDLSENCVCPADLDGSGAVDFGDILAILSAWGNAGGPEDLDGSGTVDFADLLVVLGSWGPCK